MGSLLKTPVLEGFLLLLFPALVYCDRYVSLDLFQTTNCTYVSTSNVSIGGITYSDGGGEPNTTFRLWPINNISTSFESAILKNVTGEVLSLVACQFGLECNATGAILITFNLSDIGGCSTAGPPGTQFDKFLLSVLKKIPVQQRVTGNSGPFGHGLTPEALELLAPPG